MADKPRSRLYYYGTQDEVQVGDRVMIKRWFRRDLYGTVSYIPGISPAHPELEYENVKNWAITLDDGTVLAGGYDPQDPYGQPRKNLVLINRGDGGELKPDEPLDERMP
jgi:hypothetical protein